MSRRTIIQERRCRAWKPIPSCRPSATAWSRGNNRVLYRLRNRNAREALSRDFGVKTPSFDKPTSCSSPSGCTHRRGTTLAVNMAIQMLGLLPQKFSVIECTYESQDLDSGETMPCLPILQVRRCCERPVSP